MPVAMPVLGVKPLNPVYKQTHIKEKKAPLIINVIHTHSGNWSLGGVVCRSSSGWVRVPPWVLVSWVASENG